MSRDFDKVNKKISVKQKMFAAGCWLLASRQIDFSLETVPYPLARRLCKVGQVVRTEGSSIRPSEAGNSLYEIDLSIP
jgi:hypothetical protein